MSKEPTRISSTASLREFLLDQMIAVSSGDQGHNEAKAICNYAQQVYNTINMELRVAQARAKLGDAAEVKPVSFGRDG